MAKIRYSKLVRDKIPTIILTEGHQVNFHTATDVEYKEKLHQKLDEEVSEFQSSRTAEELADVLEVINALCRLYDIAPSELEKIRTEKLNHRGGFTRRIILDEVVE